MAAKVYFSREITPEKVLELYKMAGKELTGNGCHQASLQVKKATRIS